MIELVVACAITFVAALLDWRTGRIPNWLTLGGLAVAPWFHFFREARHSGFHLPAWTELGSSALGALACGLVPFLVARKGAMGGGDVKLFALVGAWLLPFRGIEAQLYAFAAACLIAPAFLAYEGKLISTLKNSFFLLLNPLLPQAKRRPVEPEMMSWFRFGPAIFIGVLLETVISWKIG